jgi:hypothetical protein
MKATIEFNLPEDNREYKIHNQAENMLGMIQNFSEYLRTNQKHGHSFKDANHALDEIREAFVWTIEEFKLNIEL